MRLPRIAVPEAIGDYLCTTDFMSPATEDDARTIARGVEDLLAWLVDHAT